MKTEKIIIPILFVLSFSFVHAQIPKNGENEKDNPPRAEIAEHASTTRRENVPVLQDIRARIEAKKKEMNASLEIRRSALAQKLAEKTITRFEEAIARLEKLASRIDSRIKKMEAKKADTAEAKAAQIIAKEKIAAAKTKLEEIKATIASLSKPISKEGLETIKKDARAMNDAIKAAHAALADSIAKLKPGISEDKQH